jgi:D-aspartate ligase
MSKSPAAASINSLDDVRERLVPVVLGGDILGYSYVREFHRVYGINSILLATADVKAASSSRFCDYRVVKGVDQEESLISYLMDLGDELAAKGKVGILVGSGDWYARIFSQNKAKLEHRFVVPYIDFDLLDQITQKERFYSICEELGIDYPKTWLFDCADRDATIDADQFDYPLIAKPSNSARYHYAEFPGKKKIFEVQTPDELRTIYHNLQESSYDRELIVQEFIPGEDDGLRSVTTFSDDEGNLRVSCMGQVVLQDHAPSAIGNPVVIRDARVESVVEQAARFLKHVGYHGFANFDVKYDPRDGSYRFFEVNTRPGRNTFYLSLAGVPFVSLFVEDYVLGHQIPVTVAGDPFLYACVPPTVVRRTVKDPALRDDVLARYHSGMAQFPLFYDADSINHWFWAEVTYYHQIQKFKKYVWDTGGRQADAD